MRGGGDGDQYNGKPLLRYVWHDVALGALLTQSDLLARGWTKATMRNQLGEPDCYGVNPRGGAFVRLYAEARIRRVKLKLISNGEFKNDKR
jgi:hypothetical protein